MAGESIEAELHRFKAGMLISYPFYGDILLRLPILRDDTVPTACTDGRAIRWSTSFFLPLLPEEQRYVLMHEVFHTLLGHPLRAAGRDPAVWNVAADIIVNNMCDALAHTVASNPALRLKRPDSAVFCSVPPEETAENLYGKILSDNRQRERGGLLVRRDYRKAPDAGNDRLIPADIPVPDLLKGAPGGPPLSTEEREAAEQLAASLIRHAASEAGHSEYGSFKIPAPLLKLAKPKPLNWWKALKDFLSEAQSDETSYATPERKYLHMDLILPGHGLSENGELESVWAFVDSSGSIGGEDLSQFLTQLYRIVKDFRCEMNVAYWDARVTDVYTKLRGGKQVAAARPGHSGGTDINCVYRYVRDHHLHPWVALILTDGYFGTPDPQLKRTLRADRTILVLCNRSENPVYETIGRVCRLTDL